MTEALDMIPLSIRLRLHRIPAIEHSLQSIFRRSLVFLLDPVELPETPDAA